MEEKHYDLIILGSGCAGLTAAIYAARAQLRTLILENDVPGGQAAYAWNVENYPGILQIDGAQLMAKMLAQAEKSGAEIKCTGVQEANLISPQKQIITSQGIYTAPAVILATGAAPRKAGFQGEAEYTGKGVSYCGVCDGAFFKGKEVFVIGGGNSAASEAMYLTRFTDCVTMLVRKGQLRCEKSAEDALRRDSRIRVMLNTQLQAVSGNGCIEELMLRDSITGEITPYYPKGGSAGVFVYVGREPNTRLFDGQLTLDAQGYIPTDENMAASLPGVFAAGDIRPKLLRQIVTAAADGAVAAAAAARYLEEKKSFGA